MLLFSRLMAIINGPSFHCYFPRPVVKLLKAVVKSAFSELVGFYFSVQLMPGFALEIFLVKLVVLLLERLGCVFIYLFASDRVGFFKYNF